MVFKHVRALLICAFAVTFTASPLPATAAEKWQGKVPKEAEKPEDWALLLNALTQAEMPYGAMAGARNMLSFFSDLPTKELAYSTIIRLVDTGYPFSTRGDFIPGDLDPTNQDGFSQSYLLYKGIVNHDKKMEKWADYYFNKIDKENFPKYLFFRATELYGKGHPQEAIVLIKKALALCTGAESRVIAKKLARTLARIHYELGDYQKSLEIYETFLLKVNPMNPSDWIEAAWNLYQLKKYPEALGMLYNLEAKTQEPTVPLEKYVLRGLIYREFCSTIATEQLLKSFNKDFGATINGIKVGEPLSSFNLLTTVSHPQAQEYRQYTHAISELEREVKQVGSLPKVVRELATYLYTSELAMLKRGRLYFEDHALEALARHLVILGESIRFLRFDVARERFSPDRVFAEVPVEPVKLVESTDEAGFRLHWLQWGDYWRDERMLYRGLVKSACLK